MIRAAQMESLLPGHAEPVHTLQGWEWPQGTDMVDRSSDRVSSSDNIIIIIYSDAEPHDRSSLPFASKISLVREILGDKVPVSVVSREHSSRVVSLLSRGNDREGPSASHLPLAAVVRSAMFVVSTQVAAATAAAPLDRKGSADGLPLAAAAFKRGRRHYQVSSPDFALTQSPVSREVSAAGSVPNVTLPPRVMKSLEEQARLGLACQSTAEWLLAAVSSILKGCQDACNQASTLEGLRGLVRDFPQL